LPRKIAWITEQLLTRPPGLGLHSMEKIEEGLRHRLVIIRPGHALLFDIFLTDPVNEYVAKRKCSHERKMMAN